MGIDLEQYHAAVDRTKPVVHLSLDAPFHDDPDGRTLADRLADPAAPLDQGLVNSEVRTALKAAILALPERQRHAILMYYSNDLNGAEIAAVFGVTVSRVSQILTEARERLRRSLAGTLDATDCGDSP